MAKQIEIGDRVVIDPLRCGGSEELLKLSGVAGTCLDISTGIAVIKFDNGFRANSYAVGRFMKESEHVFELEFFKQGVIVNNYRIMLFRDIKIIDTGEAVDGIKIPGILEAMKDWLGRLDKGTEEVL